MSAETYRLKDNLKPIFDDLAVINKYNASIGK